MSEYFHELHCNADRREPQGGDICTCWQFRATKAETELAAANERAETQEGLYKLSQKHLGQAAESLTVAEAEITRLWEVMVDGECGRNVGQIMCQIAKDIAASSDSDNLGGWVEWLKNAGGDIKDVLKAGSARDAKGAHVQQHLDTLSPCKQQHLQKYAAPFARTLTVEQAIEVVGPPLDSYGFTEYSDLRKQVIAALQKRAGEVEDA